MTSMVLWLRGHLQRSAPCFSRRALGLLKSTKSIAQLPKVKVVVADPLAIPLRDALFST
jgi:hypothetical protein